MSKVGYHGALYPTLDRGQLLPKRAATALLIASMGHCQRFLECLHTTLDPAMSATWSLQNTSSAVSPRACALSRHASQSNTCMRQYAQREPDSVSYGTRQRSQWPVTVGSSDAIVTRWSKTKFLP
ncbi:hypothetical protein CCR75_003652 [Bremia lactucae]|uniref:Uncharacterized protein n=1 Tax=Bremia lactucae TaxID=4779 RepID=A0A976ILL2_BRELC|nr:hypothetical protein CCR75_003652 [Bremia lactucae]